MTNDEFETLLHDWGRYYRREGKLLAETTHPLERAREFAPGKRARAVVSRDGSSRRETMAQAVGGSVAIRRVPMGYVDAVPCSETRSMRTPGRDWPVPAHLERVNRAVIDLIASHPLPGLCMQARFCLIALDEDRAKWVGIRIGHDVKVKRFRDELVKGKFWVHARLS